MLTNNTKKLTIVYLDFDDTRNQLLGGGQSIATVEVGKRLAKKGHTVVSLCSRYPGSVDRVENGIHYKHISISTPFIKLNNLLYILALPFVVPRIKADIFIECFTAPISTLGSPLYAKSPVVALPSQFAAQEFSRKYKLPFYLVEQMLLPYYKYFLPYTEAVLDRIKKYNKSIIAKIVPQAADSIYFEINKKKAEYVLFLGRLDIDQKGIDLLLQAYSLIANKAPFPLVIAGHGTDEAKIQTLIKKYKLEKKVSMIGGAYGEKKMKVLSKAHSVAFPSRYDDLPIFGLEALAAGLPLICFDIPDLSFVTNKIGWKAPAFDVKAYAKTLLTAMNDQNINQKYKDSKQFSKQFSWENTADQFESFFYKIINEYEPKRKKNV